MNKVVDLLDLAVRSDSDTVIFESYIHWILGYYSFFFPLSDGFAITNSPSKDL